MSNYKLNFLSFLLGIIIIQYIKSNRLNQAGSSTQCCESEHTISLTGSARVTIPTDLITLGFTIETIDLEARNAFSKNTGISMKINHLLVKESRIPDANITTTNFQINSKYNSVYNETSKTSKQVFEGFEVSNQLEIKLTDRNLTAELIDKIVSLGVNKINYIRFDVNNDRIKDIKKILLADAIKEAYERAKIIVSNTGSSIKDVKSVTLNDYDYSSSSKSTLSYRAMASAPQKTSIYSGQQDVSISANIVFLIKNNV